MFPSSLTQVKELGARLFSRAHGYRGLIIGLDAAGKTTFLYQLKLPGESTTTIPTVGFNVEDVTSANGRKFTLWDIGGCDKARPLYRHYFPGTDVFFFMIDCTDFERFELVTVEIRAVVEYARDLEKKNMWLVLNKQDLLPARTRASVVQGLRDRLEKELSACSASFRIRIYGPSGFSSANSAQVVALLDEVAEALERAGPAPETTAAASPVTQTQPQLAGLLDRGELVKRIGDRIAQDVETADDFWDDFLHAEPLIWDHYSHLKAGYFTLIEGAARGLGVRKCADMFLGHLDTLQSRNRDRFSNTAHHTMTVFWLNYLQYAMTSYAQHRYLGTLPSREDFAEVLLHTPDVMDSGLWKRYYGRELMLFNPRARESWVSPDIQALPCSVNSIQSGELLEDASQMESSLLIKFALKIVQSTSSTNLRRGAIIKQSLSPLQTSIIRMRASKPTIPPYSDTKAYFWIQFVHAAYEALQPASAKDVSRTTGWHGHMNTLTFPAFQALFDVAGDEWRSYYSQPLWDSIEARIKFVSPDKRRLPNLISMPPLPAESKSHAPMVRKSSLGISMTKKMPSPASLSVMVAAVCDAAALSESDSPDPDVKTHADLIVFLYDTLVAQIPTGPVSDDSLAAMTKRRRDLRRRVDEALRVSGPSVEGATHKMFWIQQVLVAAEQVEGSCSSIDSFMNSNPHLAYKGLPLMYYSERALRSRQAMEVYVPPDRRALPNGSRGLVMLED